jgi:ribosomal protein S18 acetylase RimI-like enzyme
VIRPPAHAELDLLLRIEQDAGRAFADHGMPGIAADDPGTVGELEAHRAAGRAWVAVDPNDRPIAYILTAEVDDGIHIEQVSVDPAHAGRRIGAALIDHVAEFARNAGRTAVFAELPPHDWGPELEALVARERAAIPGAAPRVAMTRPV